MFKLVAFLFLLSAPEEPVRAMTYNQTVFPTEPACREFLETPDGLAAQGSIRMMGFGQGLMVKFACLETKDNTI